MANRINRVRAITGAMAAIMIMSNLEICTLTGISNQVVLISLSITQQTPLSSLLQPDLQHPYQLSGILQE
jgi:hypothetical protein